jgi:predicted RNA binding protein YcfA (HicA-like mRNA interferase family)
MKGDANTTMMSVLREGFQIEQTRVHHRIYVCDPAKVCVVLSHSTECYH